MQRGSTILQYLTVRPDVPFSDPATPDGKALELRITSHHPVARMEPAALGLPTRFRRDCGLTYSSVSSPTRNVLLQSRFPTHITHGLEKPRPADLQHFTAHNYRPFRSYPPSTPYSFFHYKAAIHTLPHLPTHITSPHTHPVCPSSNFDAVSSPYEIVVRATAPHQRRSQDRTRNRDTIMSGTLFLDAAQGGSAMAMATGFRAMDAIRYALAARLRQTEPQQQQETLLLFLFLITEYASQNRRNGNPLTRHDHGVARRRRRPGF